ncbi:MAG TPA: insulinase family protein [Actinomycetota bacterium]|nr:insulinase family protein [Actinomycetota bacterium]
MGPKTSLEVGSHIGGYVVGRREELPNIQGRYYELTHETTGARHIHIDVDDDNNVFNVAFETIPEDSTGVAHILEHVVLQGTELFPVRDLFNAMRKRSLNTFQNAMTGADMTTYPFSTRVEKDFYNMLDLYLSAAFLPLIEKQAFMQEGQRLEFKDPSDSNSELQFKGVVFNEMKGVMSSQARTLGYALVEAMFPDITYRFISGGDPEEIPNLTWEQLKEFHARFYHPSNARFYTYGNLPLGKTLGRIEELILSRFERKESHPPVPHQKSFDKPVKVTAHYPFPQGEDPNKKAEVLVSWKTKDVTDSFDQLAMDVLGDILVGSQASPLHRALIESGLGEALSSGTGFTGGYREGVFGAGLKGVQEQDAGEVEQLILDTLESLAKDGVDQELADGVVHQLEIRMKEVSNAGGPFGLRLAFRLRAAYLHGGDPYKALQLDEDLARLEEARKGGQFFEDLIRTELLDNTHRVTVLLLPDPALDSKRAEKEKKRLKSIREKLGPEDVERIVAEGVGLEKRQQEKDDLSVLPTLELSDVPIIPESVEHSVERINGTELWSFPQPTNGLTYIDLWFPTDHLDNDSKDLLSILGNILPRMGTSTMDYLEMSKRIERFTGGVSAGPHVRVPAGQGAALENFVLSGKALVRNQDELIEIIRGFITDLQIDRKHLTELVLKRRAAMQSSIAGMGHRYASLLSSSKLGSAWNLNERLTGLSHLEVLRRLAKDGEGLTERLHELAASVFRSGDLKICLTAEEAQLAGLQGQLTDVVNGLPNGTRPERSSSDFQPGYRAEARTIAGAVVHNAYTVRVPAIGDSDSPALLALSNLLQKHTTREIRQRGGAYGGNSSYQREGGLFSFNSYRDPNVERTFDIFRSVHRVVLDEPVEKENVREAILSAARGIDPLESPDTRGRRAFGDGLAQYTPELKEEFKRNLLKVSAGDIRRVAESHLSGKEGAMAIVGNQEKIEAANEAMGGIFEIKPA